MAVGRKRFIPTAWEKKTHAGTVRESGIRGRGWGSPVAGALFLVRFVASRLSSLGVRMQSLSSAPRLKDRSRFCSSQRCNFVLFTPTDFLVSFLLTTHACPYQSSSGSGVVEEEMEPEPYPPNLERGVRKRGAARERERNRRGGGVSLAWTTFLACFFPLFCRQRLS